MQDGSVWGVDVRGRRMQNTNVASVEGFLLHIDLVSHECVQGWAYRMAREE